MSLGTSPRVAGAHDLVVDRLVPLGDISRCGEQTVLPHQHALLVGNIAPVGGEQDEKGRTRVGRAGTSLPVRGAEHEPSDLSGRSGNNPAGAGSSGRRTGQLATIPGTSPQGGEQAEREFAAQISTGSIPAGAGSTTVRGRRPGRRLEHPCGCGEHSPSRARARARPGTSPRVRGARRHDSTRAESCGNIPEGSGSTGPWS